ncbi:MAG: GIY-YIG nuclease family protein [Verrucomicrobia bacterium]|nr:GIY-YIG nuclease family protein [Verrucomicrobiota bacterium]
MFFVYILACCESGRSYVGHTDHLIRRYRMHCEGSTRTSREKLLKPVVVHWETFSTRAEAMRKERYYKSGAGNRLKRDIVAVALNEFRQVG